MSSSSRHGEHGNSSKLKTIEGLVLGAILLFGSIFVTNQFQSATAASSANIDQCTNGPVLKTNGKPTGVNPQPCIIGTISGVSYSNWVNGNANDGKSHWSEGDFLSYRVDASGLTSGTHTLRIHYDTVHSGKHAIDYLGSFDATETTSSLASSDGFHANKNNPCIDKLPAAQCVPSSPAGVRAIPPAILTNCAGSNGTAPLQMSGRMVIYGPTGSAITGLVYPPNLQNAVSGTGQCSTTIDITFTIPTGGNHVVLAWGGHIAAEREWGAGNSASFISGSPYHMALDLLDGASTGSQDRALATSAVVFRPTIATIIKDSTATNAIAGNPPTMLAGTTVQDTATLTGGSSNAGGTVTYKLYTGTLACTGTQVVTVSTQTVTNGIVPSSGPVTFSNPGSYSFQATYNGDTKNLPTTSPCEPLQVGAIPQGTIIIQKVTNPTPDSTVFHFADNFKDKNGNDLQQTFNLNTATVSASSASFDVAPGIYNVNETNIPSGWALAGRACSDPNGNNSGPDGSNVNRINLNVANGETVTCTFTDKHPEARISVTPLSATNGITETHTITVKVEQDLRDGNGFVAVSGVKPTVTLTASGGASTSNVVDNCASTGTDGSGQCTVSFSSNTAGTITSHATITLSPLGLSLTRTTGDSNVGDTADATKVFVNGTLAWSKDDNQGQLLGGATFEVCRTENYVTSSNSFVDIADVCSSVVDDTDGTVGPGADKDPAAGKFLLTGLQLGKYTVKETVAPSGFAVDTSTKNAQIPLNTATPISDASNRQATIATHFVDVKPDAYITLTPLTATNGITEQHTVTVTIKQASDGVNYDNAPDGTMPTVTLSNSAGASYSIISNSCSTTGTSSGQCSIVFTSGTAGTVTVHATITLTVNGVLLTRTTGDLASSDSADASKTFVDGQLVWYKDDNAARPLGGATFTVCETDSYSTATNSFVNIQDVCFDVADNASPDQDSSDGMFKLTGLALGKYNVTEKTAPAGYVLDATPKTAQLPVSTSNPISDASNRQATIQVHFVNNRPVVKITGFGYDNAASGTPTDGVVSGTTTYKIDLHNYSGADTQVTVTFVITGPVKVTSTGGASGAAVDDDCSSGCTFTKTVTLKAQNAGTDDDAHIEIGIAYTNAPDGSTVKADLTALYTTNGLTRAASGSPASITFTIQGD